MRQLRDELRARVAETRVNLLSDGRHVTYDNRVSQKVCAEILACPESRLARWRAEGKGPRHVRLGKGCWYPLADLLEWIDNNDVFA